MNISPKISRLIEEIKNDKTQGASQLARQAVAVLKVAAEHSQADSVEHFLEELKGVGEGLMETRPAMAPIFNIVNRYLNALSEGSPSQGLDYLKGLAVAKADELARVSLQAIAEITSCGLGLITEGDKIMTHSYSSTVMAVLQEAPAEGKHIEVIVTRSGAGGTGQRIARELGRQGITVTFIDDTAVGLYVSAANKVMVGADRVCADGSIVNGVGTYQLALAAQEAAVPFYVLCETLKFDPRLESGRVDLEEKEPSEVIAPRKLPPQVRVKNPYFDITPLELVRGVVTENGLLAPEGVSGYIKRLLSA
ncbi:Methylthioribose-1-phosphate isomerase [subsurface metagenome]